MTFAGSEKPLDAPGEQAQSADTGAMPRHETVEVKLNGCQIIKAMLRFEQKLVVTEDGHRVWNGAQTKGGKGRYKINKHCNIGKRLKGKRKSNANNPAYGKFWVGPDKKQTVQAHVFAAFVAGKIPTLRVPEGCHLDHHCHHGTLCVDCTELVAAEINLERARTRPIGRDTLLVPPSQRKRQRRCNRKRVTRKSSQSAKKACTSQRNM